jgi:hypothetical protein
MQPELSSKNVERRFAAKDDAAARQRTKRSSISATPAAMLIPVCS